VTLVQNMHPIIDDGSKSLLIDLPGFHDSRTVNEVMMVNFIIDSCFSHSGSVKFIIVVSRH
jgi:GTPase Era involved in 16S rRNA processing